MAKNPAIFDFSFRVQAPTPASAPNVTRPGQEAVVLVSPQVLPTTPTIFGEIRLSGQDFVRCDPQLSQTTILYTDHKMLRDEVTEKLMQLEREGRISAFDPVRQTDDVIEAIVRVPRALFQDDQYREGLRDEVQALERDDQLISVSVLWTHEQHAY